MLTVTTKRELPTPQVVGQNTTTTPLQPSKQETLPNTNVLNQTPESLPAVSLGVLYNEPGFQVPIQISSTTTTSTTSSEINNRKLSNPPLRPMKCVPDTLPPSKKNMADINPSAEFFTNEVTIYAPFANTHAQFVEQYLKLAYKLNLLHPTTRTAILLKQMSPSEFTQEVESIRVISTLPSELANQVAFNRDIYHMPPYRSLENDNLTMMGTTGSAVRLGGGGENPYIKANAQVSILQLTTMMLDEGSGNKIVHLHVLSVSAPALDDTSIIFTLDENGEVNPDSVGLKSKARPEMETYIDTSMTPPTFNKENYKLAQDTIASHLLSTVDICNPDRVVISAYGMNNFLSALDVIDERANKPTCYKDTAQNIAAKSLAMAIKKLQDQGKEVCFSDVLAKNSTSKFASQVYWDKVNSGLKLLNAKPLTPVNGTNSALGADWAKKTDLVVNACDPDSVVGNELKLGRSFDAFFGCMSTANPVHIAASAQYQSDQKKLASSFK
jgi:hypothetical protein